MFLLDRPSRFPIFYTGKSRFIHIEYLKLHSIKKLPNGDGLQKDRFSFQIQYCFSSNNLRSPLFCSKNRIKNPYFPFLAHKKNGAKLREKAQWSKVLSLAKKRVFWWKASLFTCKQFKQLILHCTLYQ